MANRTTKVTLKAQVNEYVEGMKKAADETRTVGSEAEKLAQKREAFQQVGAAALAMGAAAATGVGLAIAKWADFDQAMSNVRAATHESAENMQLLSDAALDAGARTVFSAEEAANAIEELAKAGVSTADILSGGLDGALDLAAAGGLGVADAAGIAATALKTFNLEGEDMSHVADLLAAGAGKAMGDVTDLSAALNQSAMVANATGLSIEETTAGLAAFASQGLLGSDAGTSFKTMLMSLSGPTGKAKEEMDRLGISAFDASGNFIGLAEFAGSLEKALAGMSKEQQQATLKTIFGSDAIRAATVLYSEGEEGINKWIEAVDDQGYAAETAAARLDNLKGDLEALAGAIDTALIKTGSAANDSLRGLVQMLSGVVDAYNELPPAMQSVTLGTGILVAAIGILGGGALLAIPKIAELKIAMTTLGITARSTAGAVATLGKAVGLAGLVAALTLAADAAFEWSAQVSGAAVKADQLSKSLKDTSASAETLARSLTGQQFDFGEKWNTQAAVGNLKALNTAVGDIAGTVEKSALGNVSIKIASLGLGGQLGQTKKNIEELDAALSQMVSSGNAEQAAVSQREFAAMAREAGWSTEKIREALPQYSSALADARDAAEQGAEATGGQASALDELQDAADETTSAVDALADSIRNFGKGQFDVENATIQFYDALDSLLENLDSGKASLDVTTEAGRATHQAMLETASSTNDYAASVAAMGGSTEEVQGILDAGRQKIIETRIALGDTEEQAKAYADQLIATPQAITTTIQTNFDEVIRKGNEFAAMLRNMPAQKDIFINQVIKETGAPRGQVGAAYNEAGGMYVGGVKYFANGGIEPGTYQGGRTLYGFAEPGVPWETFISGKPSERDRNRQIWAETGVRLGVTPTTSGAQIKVIVNAAPGMDENRIVDRAVKKIERLL